MAAQLQKNTNNENVGDRSDAYMHSAHRSFDDFRVQTRALSSMQGIKH